MKSLTQSSCGSTIAAVIALIALSLDATYCCSNLADGEQQWQVGITAILELL